MKLIKSLVLLFALAFSITASAQTLPDVEIKTMEGETVNIQDYAKEGKITVISFWATWCSPCIRELKAISELYPDWVEQYDIQFLAITLDTQQRLARAGSIAETNGWEYTILSDPNQDLQRALGFQNPPQTYIIDGEGNIVYDHNGYTPGDEEDLEDKLAELTGK